MILTFVLFLIVLSLTLVTLVLALRCFGVDELPLVSRTLRLHTPVGLSGESFTRSMALKAALWGLGVLGATYLVSVICCAAERETVSWALLLRIWQQWDANNFLRIAQLGYAGYEESGMHTTLVFFPLYPWLMRLVHTVIPSYNLCGHIISAVSYTGACVVLARLVTEDFGWSAARLTLMLMSAYPFSFFFAAVFGESLFLLLCVTAFYCIRRHRWLWAGVFSALAAMTRMQGLLLAFASAVEYCVHDRPVQKLKARDWRGLGHDIWRKLLPLSVALAGTGVYLYVNWAVDGDPFRFLYFQREIWHQGFLPLPECLSILWSQLVSRWGQELMYVLWGPQLVVFAVSFAALLYGARRLPPAWTAYFLVYIMMNYSLNWPLSCGRYMACAFPLFVSLAVAFRRRPGLGVLTAFAAAMTQTAYMFVYLSGGQVM